MKRLFDLTSALVLLLCLSPVMFIVSILVRIKIGTPIFYKQERPGLHEKSFFLYKFRTMTDDRDEFGRLLTDERRMTPFGQFLRKYSLDELPQILNVIKGDLSLVGPRPLLMEYLPLYTEDQAKRHNVRPGITGWAQVNGRNQLLWEEKFYLDLWYVQNRTFILDLKILFLTFLKVLRSEGIHQPGHVTVEAFKGSNTKPAAREGQG
ncbi:MAG: sugar transferase [Tuberibacillus sp.]